MLWISFYLLYISKIEWPHNCNKMQCIIPHVQIFTSTNIPPLPWLRPAMALSPWDHSSHAITRWVGQSGVDVLDLIDGTVNVEVVDVVRKGPNTPSCLFRPKLG